MKVLLATPCAGGVVRHEYMLSILTQAFMHPDRLIDQERYDLGLYLVGGYSGLARDRGVIASYALKMNYDKLVFIDSDMKFKWQDLKKLLDSEKEIISGITPIKELPIRFNVNTLPEDKELFKDFGYKITPESISLWKQKYFKEGIQTEIPVTVVGTAFLCIDLKVLKKLATTCEPFVFQDPTSKNILQCYDFFATGAIENIYLGEDWGLCVQAQRAGFKVYVNPDVVLEHIGDFTYTGTI